MNMASIAENFLKLQTRKDVAEFLSLPEKKLNYLLYGLASHQRYKTFEISKRSGGVRTIATPIRPLKEAQRRLATAILEVYRPRSIAHAYLNKRSIISNAGLHVEKKWLLTVDLKDFFPSINFGRVLGMFLAPPFRFPPEVSTVLAQLCTHENALPQGAPTSPIISNVLCHKLDRVLLSLAKENRCHVTRYADDIAFSTNGRLFPSSLAKEIEEGASRKMVPGKDLADAINSCGFSINNSKTRLSYKDSRQLVTGLVVNKRVNLKREYIRELRAMLYSWATKGISCASHDFFSKFDHKNRSINHGEETFRAVVRGRLMFVRNVRGESDSVFRKLALKLAELDDSFKFADTAPVMGACVLYLYAEGCTDYTHIQAAHDAFKRSGKFTEITIYYGKSEDCEGEAKLLKQLKDAAKYQHPHVQMFMFDHDQPNVIREVNAEGGGVKSWGNGVFSMAIPIPQHRASESLVCIEHYYDDATLMAPDSNGRRLYFKKEFNPEFGWHLTEESIFALNPKRNTLIYDDDVVDRRAEKKVALSKKAFADAVKAGSAPYEDVDFDAFAAIFDAFLVALALHPQHQSQR